ncbi:MAG: aquaporin [Ignavibacteriales bacterium]|nr:aquaporin [Ignavibacteriales bacterium]MBI3788838.1 aquaporin [Ignavibacteriales bacterium]
MNTKALVAEFIGTFALVFVGVGAIAANAGLTGIALAHGLTIAVMVSAVGFISGGHFNPSVTIGAFLAKKIDVNNAIGYIVVQCFGAIAASVLIKMAVPEQALHSVNMGTPALGVGISTTQGLITEIILTFFLMFVIYGTAIDKRGSKVAGLFIGLTITADIFMGGPISGAAMNPARHLGPALLGGGFDNTWIYWVGPIIGSSLAALVYHNVLEEK